MANTFIVYPDETGSTTDYAVPFEYLSTAYVKATVDGVDAPFTFLSTHMIRFLDAPVGRLMIYRETDTPELLNEYSDGSVLIDDDLNASFLQGLHVSEEAAERSLRLHFDGTYTAGGLRLSQLADPVDSLDAANKNYVDTRLAADVANIEADRIAAETARDGAEAALQGIDGVLQDAEDVLDQTESVLVEAEDARDDAQAAAIVASGAMTTVIDPQFATLSTAESFSPDAAPDYIRTSGFSAAGDGGGALYKNVGSIEPDHAGKFSITLSDGVTVVWFEFASRGTVPVEAFGDIDNALSALSALKNFTLDGGGKTYSPTVGVAIDISDVTKAVNLRNITLDFSSVPGEAAVATTAGRRSYVSIAGEAAALPTLGSDIPVGSKVVSFSSPPDLRPFDVFVVQDTRPFSWYSADLELGEAHYRDGQRFTVMEVVGSDVLTAEPARRPYAAANMQCLRFRSGEVNLERVTVIGNPLADGFVSGITLSRLVNDRLSFVRSYGPPYTAIFRDRTFDFEQHYCYTLDDNVVNRDTDYGMVLCNVAGGRVVGGHYTAARHGVATGSLTEDGNIPNDDVLYDQITTSSHSTLTWGFDTHGITERFTSRNCRHLSGMDIAGADFTSIDDHVYSDLDRAAIHIYRWRSGAVKFVNPTLVVAGDPTGQSRGIIDFGGNGGGTEFLVGDALVWLKGGKITARNIAANVDIIKHRNISDGRAKVKFLIEDVDVSEFFGRQILNVLSTGGVVNLPPEEVTIRNLIGMPNPDVTVRVATTAAGALASDFEDGDTVDGVVLAAGDRILIKDQTNAAENGIYVVEATGAPTRATDADTGVKLKGLQVYISGGSQQRQLYRCTSENIDLGTTGVVWQRVDIMTVASYAAGLEPIREEYPKQSGVWTHTPSAAPTSTAPINLFYQWRYPTHYVPKISLSLQDNAAGDKAFAKSASTPTFSNFRPMIATGDGSDLTEAETSVAWEVR